MNKTTEALKLAEESLHNVQNALLFVSGSVNDTTTSTMTADAHDDADKALAAIREALAEQEKQEPVTEWEKLKDPQTLFVNLNRGFPAQLTPDHLLHLLNKTEQEKQEPVYAFRRRGLDDFCTCTKERYEELVDNPNLFEVTTFYADPVSAEAIRAEALEEAAKVCRTAQAKGLQSIREAIEAAIGGLK